MPLNRTAVNAAGAISSRNRHLPSSTTKRHLESPLGTRTRKIGPSWTLGLNLRMLFGNRLPCPE